MARASTESPESWFGTRTVITLSVTCGWCNTADHDNCLHELGYYDKLWICGCDCNKNWQPVAVVVERKEQPKDATKSKVSRTTTRARKSEADAVGTRTEVSGETEPES